MYKYNYPERTKKFITRGPGRPCPLGKLLIFIVYEKNFEHFHPKTSKTKTYEIDKISADKKCQFWETKISQPIWTTQFLVWRFILGRYIYVPNKNSLRITVKISGLCKKWHFSEEKWLPVGHFGIFRPKPIFKKCIAHQYLIKYMYFATLPDRIFMYKYRNLLQFNPETVKLSF